MFGTKLKQLSKLTKQVSTLQKFSATRQTPFLFNNLVSRRHYATDISPGQKPKDEVGAAKKIDEPPFIRMHDVNPNPTVRTWAQTLAPTKPGERNELESYWLNLPTLWERAVGNERAELIDPNIYDELLPEIIDIENGVGSSFYQPIVISSMGESERVVGCLGRCYDGDNIDLDSAELQFWVMTENTFGVCDECGLVFFLASEEVLSQMEIWRQLKEESIEGGYDAPLLEKGDESHSGH